MNIAVPIVCCSECRADYTVTEWHDLPIDSGTLTRERRVCTCGHVMMLPTVVLADFESARPTMPLAEYERIYPDSARARVAARRAPVVEVERAILPMPTFALVAVVWPALLLLGMIVAWLLFSK